MPYMPERGTDYMAHGGCRMGCTCVCCGSEGIEFAEAPNAMLATSDVSLTRKVGCPACGSNWIEMYRLEGIKTLDDQDAPKP